MDEGVQGLGELGKFGVVHGPGGRGGTAGTEGIRSGVWTAYCYNRLGRTKPLGSSEGLVLSLLPVFMVGIDVHGSG